MSKTKTMLSIDIGNEKIKITEGSQINDRIFLKNIGALSVPEYSIDHENIKNAEVISDDIKSYLHTNNFSSKNVIITINAVDALTSDIDLPKSNPKDLYAMIKNEMIHSYHIDQTDVIQYKQIATYQNDANAPMYTYRVSVMEAEFIDKYYQLMQMLQLKPIAMDINMNAMDKLVKRYSIINEQDISQKTVMILDLGAITTTAYIYENGEQKFFRQLLTGSSEIEQLISDATLTPPLEIKKMKEQGYNFFSADADTNYLDILQLYFYRFNEDIRNMIRFYSNKNNSAELDQIFLTGGGSKLAGLPQSLQDQLNLPVERILSMQNANNHALPKSTLLTHLNTFGALIRY